MDRVDGELHLDRSHLQQVIPLIILHFHNIVHRFDTRIFASLDDLAINWNQDNIKLNSQNMLTSGSK
jgi:hypothetical protein